jgi:hypothetical protein
MKQPTKQEVENLVRKTGESHRKCYYWLLNELNKGREPAETQEELFSSPDEKTDE